MDRMEIWYEDSRDGWTSWRSSSMEELRLRAGENETWKFNPRFSLDWPFSHNLLKLNNDYKPMTLIYCDPQIKYQHPYASFLNNF